MTITASRSMSFTTEIRYIALLLIVAIAVPAVAFQASDSNIKNVVRSNTVQLSEAPQNNRERRTFLTTGTAAVASLFLLPKYPALAENDEFQEVYFGCGCFWHVQHEFVEAEKRILGRSDDDLTARVGYAGGKLGRGKDGKVCYHNAAGASDYGKLGHGEVVSLKIPTSKFQDFATEYCKLFKNGMRPDQLGDRGLEYRNLVAIKGGSNNDALTKQLIEASRATGDQLGFADGNGSDEDIAKLVWIMDIDEFPFYVGEAYHQFHDGFAYGENYPNEYNELSQKYVKRGEDFGTCPNGRLSL